jgi:hypothetical protein
MLGLGLDSWNNVMLFFLAVGAFAAALVGVSTFAVVQLQKAETQAAKDEFEKYKVDAGLEIAKANEAAGKANERAATLEKEAAQARAEQERLRGQLAWRRLTKVQHDAIVAALRAYRPPLPLDVVYPLGDAEAATFAAEIVRCLGDAGIAVAGNGASTNVWTPTPPFGMILTQPGAVQIANPIAQALVNAGFDVNVELHAPALKLIIGSKPAPF